MAVYTWDAIYDRLKVDQGGLPNKSTQDMLDTFWTLAGYPDGTLGADEKVAFYESQGAVGDSLGDLEYDYWYRIGPNILAAKGAVFAIDAAQSISGEQWVLNRGSGGQVLRAKYGSVARAEIRNGVGLVQPGSGTANYALSNTATVAWGSGCEVIVRFDGSLRPSGNVGLTAYGVDSAANRSFVLLVLTGGYLALGVQDATTTYWPQTTAPIPQTSGDLWVRAVAVVSGGNVSVTFYTAPASDAVPTSWTQLGTVATLAFPSTITTGAWPFVLGAASPGNTACDGAVKRVIWRDGGGSTVLDVDFTAQADLTTSFTCTTGQTVTVTAANAVDTNDPLRLDWDGANYVRNQPSNVIGCTCPTAFYGSTALDVRMAVQPITWTAPPCLVGPGYSSAVGALFRLQVEPGYQLNLHLSDGASYVTHQGSASLADAVGYNPCGIRVTWDGVANEVKYYYRLLVNPADALSEIASHTGWTQLGSTVASTVDTLQASTVQLFGFVGYGVASGSNPDWNLYAGWVSNQVAGSAVIAFNLPSLLTGGHNTSVAADTGQTIVFTRASSGRKLAVVTRPIWLFGTDDYLEVADNDLLDFTATDDFTAIAIMRVHGNQSNNARVFDKFGGGSIGWRSYIASGTRNFFGTVADGTNFPQTAVHAMSDGTLTVAAYRRFGSGTGDNHVTYLNNAVSSTNSDSTTGTLANSLPFTIGNLSGGSNFLDGEVLAVGIFRRALTATEIAQIVTAYGAT